MKTNSLTHKPPKPVYAGLSRRPKAQQGVVLVVALIMLIVISLLAAVGTRNAASSETVSGNIRTTELATQSAEIALRYCETAVQQIVSGTGTLASLPTVSMPASPPNWQDMDNWDGAGAATATFVIPASSVNTSTATVAFKRSPECQVERMTVGTSTTRTFVITARGFGPEVAAGTGRPQGSEVWLQSTFELN